MIGGAVGRCGSSRVLDLGLAKVGFVLDLRDDVSNESPQPRQTLIEPHLGHRPTHRFVAVRPGLLVLRGGGVGAKGVGRARGPEQGEETKSDRGIGAYMPRKSSLTYQSIISRPQ